MPFFLVINLDVVSLSNVFSSLIYVFRYKGITVLNKWNLSLHCQKKKKVTFIFSLSGHSQEKFSILLSSSHQHLFTLRAMWDIIITS